MRLRVNGARPRCDRRRMPVAVGHSSCLRLDRPTAGASAPPPSVRYAVPQWPVHGPGLRPAGIASCGPGLRPAGIAQPPARTSAQASRMERRGRPHRCRSGSDTGRSSTGARSPPPRWPGCHRPHAAASGIPRLKSTSRPSGRALGAGAAAASASGRSRRMPLTSPVPGSSRIVMGISVSPSRVIDPPGPESVIPARVSAQAGSTGRTKAKDELPSPSASSGSAKSTAKSSSRRRRRRAPAGHRSRRPG